MEEGKAALLLLDEQLFLGHLSPELIIVGLHVLFMIVIKVAQCNMLLINQEIVFEPCHLDRFFIFLMILEP
jgi:hypothetical protein